MHAFAGLSGERARRNVAPLSLASPPEHHFDRGRRAFLRTAAIAAGAVLLPRTGRALDPPRRLLLAHTHTGERADVTYFEAGAYLPDALEELDRFLRDFRTGEVHPIDPSVLDIAWRTARLMGATDARLHVVSAYRSPATNASLRARGRGVATRSLHLEGKALDLRIPGVPTERIRDAALSLQLGGVGYYARSDFVHVDTGRVRRWSA